MKHNQIYGIALILGALGTVITMIFHPTGSDLLQENLHAARQGEFLAVTTHSLALISYPVLCFGFLGLYRSLPGKQLICSVALIAYVFGGFAIMIAATASGLVAPSITSQIPAADESTRQTLHMFLDYNFSINQAFTKIFVVASSFSIIIWSVAVWSEGLFARIIGVLGCIISLISLAAFFAGHLRLDVHGFGLFAFAQAFWLIITGVFLFRVTNHSR